MCIACGLTNADNDKTFLKRETYYTCIENCNYKICNKCRLIKNNQWELIEVQQIEQLRKEGMRPRDSPCVSQLDQDCIVIFGGWDDSGVLLSDNYIFNTETNMIKKTQNQLMYMEFCPKGHKMKNFIQPINGGKGHDC